ncbi:MAG: tRNA (guanosine(37)-N1)-methyltransferase TrmD [Pseudomonadota bacterium]
MTGRNRSHGRLSIRESHTPRDLMAEPPRQKNAWTARVITLFPECFPGVLGHSLMGKALSEGLWTLETLNLRDFATGRHRNVDDTPAGGGAGMVLRADVVARALDVAKRGTTADWPVIYLSPRGIPFNQALARSLSRTDGVTLLCGRFEGVDQRVLDARQVIEVSLGDYVISGGEIAAQALIDATVRLIPRVLGNAESVEEESFSNGLLEHPHYTRPTEWEGHVIPEILLSGHHGKVAEWRHAQSERLTQERRPDLWRAHLKQIGDPVEGQEHSDTHTIADKGESKD